MTTIAYVRHGNDPDVQATHDLTVRGVDMLFEDKGGSRSGLAACLRSARPGDVIVVTRLSQFALGAGGIIKLSLALRYRAVHLAVLNIDLDTRRVDGWAFFNHMTALHRMETELARARSDAQILTVGRPRGRKGSPGRRKLTAEQVEAAQQRIWSRSYPTLIEDIAREYNVSRATLYRSGACERPW